MAPWGHHPQPCGTSRKPTPTNSEPGHTHVENNLKLMCYLLWHMHHTSHTITAAGITVMSIWTLCDHHCWEQDHEDLDPSELNAKDWPRTIEAIDKWLKGSLGVLKIPLAYVIRDEKAVPDQATDPSTNYETVQDELVA